ncbi:GAF domain-containing hybrid sensor histidine kinase/response regulator [Bdellovibrio sp. NC01]|uniref:hybrid sensor histidine kinase/response regulator n=1 Tax=Bdellovibrio sp. NC01 TaxID=2220073 RepID=UPI00115717F8|nr:GAF domain-containing hybrid sensor histidine kinase/response regulator [Bdellovibrio sp. NC01]QDK38705.1 hybrid sensor histidine kinase/response regulator [Bdellovibrio sp. NC01]
MARAEMKRLVSVIQDLSAVKSIEEIMTLVRSSARDLVHADGATFVLRDNGFCFYADEDAISPLWKGQKFPMDSCVSGWSMTHKQSVVIPDIYKDSRIPLEAYKPTFVKSLAMFPIRKENPIGAIGVYWAKEYTPTSEEREMLQALADTVSVAMENVELVKNLKAQIDQLDQANKAKDNFLMTVSHELRTPLNSILGWSEMLTEEQSDDRETQRGLETIARNARNQAHIVDDLLDTSRMMVGRLALDLKPTDLVAVAKEAIQSVHFDAQKKRVEIEFLSQMPSALVLGDANRLRQVFANLLTNAIKFSKDDGQIFVKIQKSGPGVLVKVEDHGEGISPEFMDVIFDRFKQADESVTRHHGGLGLGLSITKYLVEAHGGKIKASSPGVDKGATLEFSIPLIDLNKEKTAEALSMYAKNSTERVHPLTGAKILVVDDDDDSRALVETILKKNGAKVEKADSVNEALRLAQLFPFDLVVSDLSMPEEDGFSLARKVRAGRTSLGTQTPMIAVTAFTDKESEQKALGNGFNEFFGKPFSSPKLVSKVAHLVGLS